MNNKKKVRKGAYFWTRWAWDEHAADTAHLTPLEEGIYMRLLRLYYRDYRGPLPDDAALLARKVGARSDDERKAVEVLLHEFFRKGEGGTWQHTRCDRELAAVRGTSDTNTQIATDAVVNRQRDAQGRLISQRALDQTPAGAGEQPSRVRDRDKERDRDTPKEELHIGTTSVGDSSLGDSSSQYAPPNTNPNRVGADISNTSTPTPARVTSAEGSQASGAPASAAPKRDSSRTEEMQRLLAQKCQRGNAGLTRRNADE